MVFGICTLQYIHHYLRTYVTTTFSNLSTHKNILDRYCGFLNFGNSFHLGCFNPSLVGDGYCDDVTNSLDCNYDGGDCCGSFVNNQYCTECQCIGGSGIGILSRNSETTTLSTKGQ